MPEGETSELQSFVYALTAPAVDFRPVELFEGSPEQRFEQFLSQFRLPEETTEDN